MLHSCVFAALHPSYQLGWFDNPVNNVPPEWYSNIVKDVQTEFSQCYLNIASPEDNVITGRSAQELNSTCNAGNALTSNTDKLFNHHQVGFSPLISSISLS